MIDAETPTMTMERVSSGWLQFGRIVIDAETSSDQLVRSKRLMLQFGRIVIDAETPDDDPTQDNDTGASIRPHRDRCGDDAGHERYLIAVERFNSAAS